MNYKPNGKLKMGPIWDYDLGFGNYGNNTVYDDPEGFYIKGVTWYDRLFTDSVFVNRVKERFNYYYTNRQNIYDYIDSTSALLIEKIKEDNNLWGQISDTTSSEGVVKANYQQKVDDLKSWIDARFQWLYTNINAL